MTRLPQDAGQGGLAHLDRLPAHVGAIQLQQIEGYKGSVPALAQDKPDAATTQRPALFGARWSTPPLTLML